MSLTIGDQAPSFSLLSDQNKLVSLAEFLGKKVILYFYPKDNTPGCNKEACDFRDAFPHIESSDCMILGISKDSPETHAKFKKKFNLPFILLSDPNAEVCERYGVINVKSLFGRSFLGIQRSTFLMDETGIIRAIWRKVKVKGHSQQVMNELNTY